MCAKVELRPAHRTPHRQLAHPAVQVLTEAGQAAVPLPGWGASCAPGDAPKLSAAAHHANGVRALPPVMVGIALPEVAVGASAPAPGAPAVPGPTIAAAAAPPAAGGEDDDQGQGSGAIAGGGSGAVGGRDV